MSRQLRPTIAAIGNRAFGAFNRLLATEQSRRARPWFAANGDTTLRVQYPLDSSSVVLDVGGYEGTWASDIFSRYLCTIHVFEPEPSAARAIEERFAHNPHIHVHAVGLGARDERVDLSVSADRSSVLVGEGPAVKVELRAAAPLLRDLGIESVDLLKVNIEGGEYDLLDHLIDEGVVTHVRDIQVQFHDFFPDARRRMEAIQQRLRATHDLTWQYEFVWENWRRRRE